MVRITNEKIKLYIWIVLGSLGGVLDLLPAFSTAAESLHNLADGKLEAAIALNQTSNCGKNGSNTQMDNLANSSEGLGEALSYTAAVLAEETDSAGQLALLGGDLSKLTDAFRFLAEKANGEADDLKIFAKYIDVISIQNVAKLAKALQDEADAVDRLNNAIADLKGPSTLLTQLGSGLSTFNDGVRAVSKNVYILRQSTIAGQERCDTGDTGIPGALANVVTEADALSYQLSILSSN